jgi:predicted membrane protein
MNKKKLFLIIGVVLLTVGLLLNFVFDYDNFFTGAMIGAGFAALFSNIYN